MNKSTFGEDLFEKYLTEQGIKFDREPKLPGVAQLIDFVVEHPACGKVLLEVKDIDNAQPVLGFSQFDPYRPIRSHIKKASEKFKSTSDYICALVLAARAGNLVDLNSPDAMLGAMYGDFGFTIPVDVEHGDADVEQISTEFQLGKGKMLHMTGPQNTRIVALITIQQYGMWRLEMRKYLDRDDGRTRKERFEDIRAGRVDLPDADEQVLGVTVWENGVAEKKLPTDMFRGEMDARWECDGKGNQELTFIGERRRVLGIDNRL